MQFLEHKSAQLPLVVTCPTRESAEIAMTSGLPIRFSGRAFCVCFRSFPAAVQGLSLWIGLSDGNLTSPAACATLGIDGCACDTGDNGQVEQDQDSLSASAASLEGHGVTSSSRIMQNHEAAFPGHDGRSLYGAL